MITKILKSIRPKAREIKKKITGRSFLSKIVLTIKYIIRLFKMFSNIFVKDGFKILQSSTIKAIGQYFKG